MFPTPYQSDSSSGDSGEEEYEVTTPINTNRAFWIKNFMMKLFLKGEGEEEEEEEDDDAKTVKSITAITVKVIRGLLNTKLMIECQNISITIASIL